MCLAVPYTITEIFGENAANAVSGGVGVGIRLDLLESPQVGDVVLVHAGFAIQKLEKAEAEELFSLWDEADALALQTHNS